MKSLPPRRVIFLGSFRVSLAVGNVGLPVSVREPAPGPAHLIAKDEPLIAPDITLAFEDEGAWVVRARTLNEALLGADDCALSAAILDPVSSRWRQLRGLRLPEGTHIRFVTYSRHDDLVGLKKRLASRQLRGAVDDGSIVQHVSWRAVLPGDVVFVPAASATLQASWPARASASRFHTCWIHQHPSLQQKRPR